MPWNKSSGQSSVFIFDTSSRYESQSLSFRKDIFYHRRKKERKKEGKKINKSSGNNASSYYPFLTVNYDKRDRDLRTRARQVTRAVDGRFIDYSSRRKWRGRAGNSGNSSAKLAPSNEPFPSRAPSTLPPVPVPRCERNERRESHRERNRLRHAGRSPLTEFLISNLNRQRSLLGYTIETLQFQTSLYRVGLRNQLAR